MPIFKDNNLNKIDCEIIGLATIRIDSKEEIKNWHDEGSINYIEKGI